MNEDPRLYAIAKKVTLEAGLPYTDPRTGETTKASSTTRPGALLEKQAEIVDHLRKRMSRVINRQYVKDWALDYAATNRAHPFTRVSNQFLNAIEAATKAAIRDRIDRAPSKGKTLL